MLSQLLSDIRYRLRALFSRASVEQELDDELRFHIEREAEKYERQGMSHEPALRRARLAFGGVEQVKEASRDMRGIARLESIVRDLRYAMRSLKSRPAFTLTVIATLGLGIGANTAIFTLVDALVLRPLPVLHPEQLVIVSDPAEVNTNNVGLPLTDYVSVPLYRDVRARNTVFTDMYANGESGTLDVQMSPGTNATAEQPHARFVTGNFFSVLGVPAYAGRTFTAAEDKTPGEDPVAVLTYDYAQGRFSRSRAAIGSVMRVSDVAVTIVGVTPPGFHGDIVGQPIDFWLPMMMHPAIQPRQDMIDDRAWSWVVMMGRLKPGVTLEQARQEVSAIEANAIRDNVSGRELSRFEDNLKEAPIQVVSGARGFSERRAEYGKALWVLMAAVGLVILVVCANVSSLMLARTVARNREITLRMTLGAGRDRLIQQMLVEGTLLAIVSSVLGLFVATWGARVLLMTVSASSPIAIDTTPDGRGARRPHSVRARARRGPDGVVAATAHRRRLARAQHATTAAQRYRSRSRSRRCRARADGAVAVCRGAARSIAARSRGARAATAGCGCGRVCRSRTFQRRRVRISRDGAGFRCASGFGAAGFT